MISISPFKTLTNLIKVRLILLHLYLEGGKPDSSPFWHNKTWLLWLIIRLFLVDPLNTLNLVKLRGMKNRSTTSESILSPLCLRFIVSSVDVKEKNWSSDLQWNAVTNRHSRSVTHPCETKVIKQHLLQINLKASRSVTQSKPSLKIGSVNKAFLFFKMKSWNFQHLFEKKKDRMIIYHE